MSAAVLTREAAIGSFGPGRADSVVFTNGCFDLLHEGHRSLLARASALGDRLLVALNSDESVRGLKGTGRPVQSVEARARALAALEVVDGIVVFDEETPIDLIEAIVPDILVKGADYRPDEVAGREVVERAGGKLVLLPLVEGVSTSRRIAESDVPRSSADPSVERRVHGLRVVIERELCLGYADCVEEAPEAFDIDASGLAILTTPERSTRKRLLQACAVCPVDAIRVYGENGEIVP